MRYRWGSAAWEPLFIGWRQDVSLVGGIPTAGTAIAMIRPPVLWFSKNNGHAAKKQAALDRLAAVFERYFGLARARGGDGRSTCVYSKFMGLVEAPP